MAKGYSKEEIEKIMQENKELREFKDKEQERRDAQRERQKESGAYRKQYEKQKERMANDPEFAKKVKTQRKTYHENRRKQQKADKEELKRYRDKYGPLKD
jgi:hypothetical protein